MYDDSYTHAELYSWIRVKKANTRYRILPFLKITKVTKATEQDTMNGAVLLELPRPSKVGAGPALILWVPKRLVANLAFNCPHSEDTSGTLEVYEDFQPFIAGATIPLKLEDISYEPY